MGSEDENYEHLLDDGDLKRHSALVSKVLSLNKVQQIKKATRTEPSLQISEYNLVKSITGKPGHIKLADLTKALTNRKSRLSIKKQVSKLNRDQITLPKPLERPQAERIRRGVAYEKTRLELDRWESVVTSNRAAEQLNFPLNNDLRLNKKEKPNFASNWRLKSKLEEELEKLNAPPVVETYDIRLEEDDTKKLTLREILARRKEAAKLRAFQGYKEAKARQQSKIKSKKYHRILKKATIRKKLKQFELLQKSDPEAALQKLEEIERVRAEERMSLRHRSTGKWAQNKQVRAKYDKGTRQELAEQLAIGRELTDAAKNVESASSGDEEELHGLVKGDEDNPWVNGLKPEEEVENFIANYRKFWTEQNKTLEEDANQPKTTSVEVDTDRNGEISGKEGEEIKGKGENVDNNALKLKPTFVSESNQEIKEKVDNKTKKSRKNSEMVVEKTKKSKNKVKNDALKLKSFSVDEKKSEASNKPEVVDKTPKQNKNNKIEAVKVDKAVSNLKRTSVSVKKSTKKVKSDNNALKLLIADKKLEETSKKLKVVAKTTKQSENNKIKAEKLNMNAEKIKKIKLTSENVIKFEETSKRPKVIDKTVKQNQNNKIKVEKAVKLEPVTERKQTKKLKKKTKGTSDWMVTPLSNTDKIEEIFAKAERNLVQKKMKSLQKTLKIKTLKKSNKVGIIKPKKNDLTIKSQRTTRPIIDEVLDEVPTNQTSAPTEPNLDNLREILAKSTKTATQPKIANIDPNQYLEVKQTRLQTAVPQVLVDDSENIDDFGPIETQHDIIAEAFEDDDIVDDFSKEKQEEVDKHKPKDVDLSLPGWGSWGGAGIVISKRKKRRFMMKVPKKLPRKDDNRGILIINEEANKKVKEHLVSEIPFPFRTIQDYEASIRAPISNSFVPETAFRKFIRPAITTKMGAVIEPMSRDVLIQK